MRIARSDVWGKVGVSVDGSVFDTDGYANVLSSLQGPVDTKVAVQFGHVTLKADYNPNDRVHAFVRTGYFHEDRHNGKITTVGPLTEELNDTTWKYTSGGVRAAAARREHSAGDDLRRHQDVQ